MVVRVSIIFLILLGVNLAGIAQKIPKNPNAEKGGKRQGKWTLLMDKDWNPTESLDSVTFYRVITYKDDVPTGVVRDYYRDGHVQWEGLVLADRPSDVYHGVVTWYYQNGTKEQQSEFEKGRVLWNVFFKEDGSEDVWRTATFEGQRFMNMNNLGKAKELYLKALAFAEAQPETPLLPDALDNLGTLHTRMEDFQKADEYFKRALELKKERFGEDSPNYAVTLSEFAYLKMETGRYSESEKMALQNLEIWRKHFGENDPRYATALRLMGRLYYRMDKPQKAEEYLLPCIQIRRETVGKYHWMTAEAITDLANVSLALGKFDKAESLYNETMDIHTRLIGTNNMAHATDLGNLSALYMYSGRYERAEEAGIKSLELVNKLMGERSIRSAAMMRHLAQLYTLMGMPAKAQPLNLKAIEIYEKTGHTTEAYGTTLIALGKNYAEMLQFRKADSLCRQGLSSVRTQLGAKHNLYADACLNAAGVALMVGDANYSMQLYKEAMEIKRERGPLDFAKCMHELAKVNWTTGNMAEAEALELESINKHYSVIESNLPFFSEVEKEQFYYLVKDRFEAFHSFGIARYKENPAIAEQMYDAQLYTKAILLNSAAKWKQRIRTSGDTKLFALYTVWEENQYAIARLSKNLTPAARRQLDSIVNQTNALEKELSQRSELFARLSDRKRASWKDIQLRLKPGEAAIEMIRLRKFGVRKAVTDTTRQPIETFRMFGLTDTIQYAALVVTPGSKYPDLVLFDNGNEMEGRAAKRYSNLVKAQSSDGDSYDLYWRPLATAVGKKVRKIYFSTDGVYNTINLNTLYNTKTRKYLIDEIRVQLVTNTKDLLAGKPEENFNNLAYLFGSPNFHLPKDKRAALVEKERTGVPAYYALNLERGTNLSELPGTLTEVTTISGLLASHGWQPQVATGDQALEETLKDIFKPRLLHIATHGFFQPDPVGSAKMNPLLQSGLLLTGAGRTLGGEKDEDTEDGILTAFEAMNLNLDNTDLVVLSACETGLGELRNGEGVYGLQRAFKVAGARSIIMSLWKVNDVATQELITAFYENWLKTGNKDEAFIDAQLLIREKYPNPYHSDA